MSQQGLSAISFLPGPAFPKEMLWQFSLKAPRGWARTPSRPGQGGWWHGRQAPGSGQPGPRHCQATEVTGLSAGGLSASPVFTERHNCTNSAYLDGPGEGHWLQLWAPSSSDRSRPALWAVLPKRGTPRCKLRTVILSLQTEVHAFHFSAHWPRSIGTSELLVLTERPEAHAQYGWTFTDSTQALNADKHKNCSPWGPGSSTPTALVTALSLDQH